MENCNYQMQICTYQSIPIATTDIINWSFFNDIPMGMNFLLRVKENKIGDIYFKRTLGNIFDAKIGTIYKDCYSTLRDTFR